MSEFDESVVRAFVEDALEQMSTFGDDVLTIEQAGAEADPELVNRAFRAVHSIKGGAGFLSLDRITELSHSMEEVLNRVRNDDLSLTFERASVLLQAADALTDMLTNPDTSNDTDITAHQQGLAAVLEQDEESGGSGQDGMAQDTRAEAVVAQPSSQPMPSSSGSNDFTTTVEQAQQALETLDYLYRLEYRQGEDAAFDDLPSLAAELKATGEIL
ncbi:MAG: hypothetical protein HOB49_25725, partial [Gemmatimonadetes bacterium]|nr:hypothetical protein [Gemmatimonadota bacterium]